MTTILFVAHLAAVLLAAIALWSMRHEYTERATTRFDWALPVVLAVIVAAVLLIVSPGKRFELWLVCIGAGFAIGLAVGMVLKGEKDFASNLVRVYRAWDGLAAAAGLLLLAMIRAVTSELMGRPSGGYGVLGALAALLAAYLLGRLLTFHLYTAPKSIHLDMVRGQRRHRT
jgi:hypothetical protein